MKLPPIEKLHLPAILRVASRFPCKGKLDKSKNNLVYLNIDDAFIHELFPLLPGQEIKKPDYFAEGSVGAHISVVYPEEKKEITPLDLAQEHHFSINELITAKIGPKTYYALLIESPSLLQLRKRYGLPELLCFKGYSIGFHITIGTKI